MNNQQKLQSIRKNDEIDMFELWKIGIKFIGESKNL